MLAIIALLPTQKTVDDFCLWSHRLWFLVAAMDSGWKRLDNQTNANHNYQIKNEIKCSRVFCFCFLISRKC